MTVALAPYAPPTVTVQPVTGWTPGNQTSIEIFGNPLDSRPQYNIAGGYRRPDIFIILNLRTGQLHARSEIQAFESRYTELRGGWNGPGLYDPSSDLWIRGYGWPRTPTLIGWVANSLPWLENAEGVNTHLDLIRPYAQQLVDALDPVPGTDGDYDWTPQATGAERNINALVTSYDNSTAAVDTRRHKDRDRYGVVTFNELLEAGPDLIDPLWATMTGDELDAVARTWTGDGGRYSRTFNDEVQRRLYARFNWAGWHNGVAPDQQHYQPIYIIGARTALREFRAQAIADATGLPTAPISRYYPDGYAGADLTASTTDTELDWIAACIDATAATGHSHPQNYPHRDKVALIGTVDMLTKQRTTMRTRVRHEAAKAGRHAAALENQLRGARATRDGLLSVIVGFGEHPEHNPDGTLNYAELGRIGGISRVATRNKFGTTDEPADTPV